MNLASIKFKRIDKEDLVLQRWNLRKVLQKVTFLPLLVYVLTKDSSIPDHSFHSKWFAKLLKRKYRKGRWYSENSLDNSSGTCCCSCGYLWMEDAFAQHHLVAVEILKQRGPADYNSPELCLSDCLKCKMRCWPRKRKSPWRDVPFVSFVCASSFIHFGLVLSVGCTGDKAGLIVALDSWEK